MNVTFRRVRLTTVAMDKQYVLYILSVSVALNIQHAKRVRLLYYRVWPVRLFHFFLIIL
jgi:hypothetical protein